MCATCLTTPPDTESGSAICALPDYLISAFLKFVLRSAVIPGVTQLTKEIGPLGSNHRQQRPLLKPTTAAQPWRRELVFM
jgi:hypothetical protein